MEKRQEHQTPTRSVTSLHLYLYLKSQALHMEEIDMEKDLLHQHPRHTNHRRQEG
jgi:hypothetical protein